MVHSYNHSTLCVCEGVDRLRRQEKIRIHTEDMNIRHKNLKMLALTIATSRDITSSLMKRQEMDTH